MRMPSLLIKNWAARVCKQVCVGDKNNKFNYFTSFAPSFANNNNKILVCKTQCHRTRACNQVVMKRQQHMIVLTAHTIARWSLQNFLMMFQCSILVLY
jgi:hypothetical protein